MDNCVFVSKELIEKTLATEAREGKGLVEPLKSFALENNSPLKILEDKEVVNEPEVHIDAGDLWGCLQGEVIFIYGGKLVGEEMKKDKDGKPNAKELTGKEIKNGTEKILHPGDWLWIPPGQPHAHQCKKTARLFIIKVPKKS